MRGKDQGEEILLAVNSRVTCEVLDTSVDFEYKSKVAPVFIV